MPVSPVTSFLPTHVADVTLRSWCLSSNWAQSHSPQQSPTSKARAGAPRNPRGRCWEEAVYLWKSPTAAKRCQRYFSSGYLPSEAFQTGALQSAPSPLGGAVEKRPVKGQGEHPGLAVGVPPSLGARWSYPQGGAERGNRGGREEMQEGAEDKLPNLTMWSSASTPTNAGKVGLPASCPHPSSLVHGPPVTPCLFKG